MMSNSQLNIFLYFCVFKPKDLTAWGKLINKYLALQNLHSKLLLTARQSCGSPPPWPKAFSAFAFCKKAPAVYTGF